MDRNPSLSFAGLPEIPLKDARFVVLPIPYEATVSCRVGAKFGPEAVLLASRYIELYDEELGTELSAAGIRTFPEVRAEHAGPAAMLRAVERAVLRHAEKGRIVAVVGGEHGVTVGAVRAYRRVAPDLRVLHLDAHADLRPAFEGTPYSHACVVRRIVEEGASVSSFGIRSLSREEAVFIKTDPRAPEVRFAHQMAAGWEASAAAAPPGGRYYITVDVDFFDPAVVPDTGTPEPGGFFWRETVGFLRAFIARPDVSVVGFDAVELAPREHLSPSCFLVARLLHRMIGCLAARGG